MKKPVRIAFAFAAAVVVLGAAAFIGQRIHQASAVEPSDKAEDSYSLNGDVLTADNGALATAGVAEKQIQPTDVPVTLTLTGRSGLNMETVTHVRAQFGGKVVNIGPQLGAHVDGPDGPKGATVLCVIESNDLAQAKSNYIQAKIQARQDQEAYTRTKELVNAKVLAEKFLIDALSTLVKDKAAEEAARQQLLIFGLKQDEIDQVQNEVGRQRMDYVINCPRSGVIAEKGVAGGEIADPTLNLFTIADTKTMWVWGDVYERDLSKVKVGQPINVNFTSDPPDHSPRTCTIDWISPVMDPNTHSIKIRGLLDNADGSILSDMYGTLTLTIDAGKHSIVVPSDAVVRQGDSAFVFLKTSSDGKKTLYRRVPVKIQPINMGFGAADPAAASAAPLASTQPSSQLRIVDGVHAGDTIVVSGALSLFGEMEQQTKGQ